MGLFSWDCKCCGHPMLCEGATTKGVNEWMNEVVVLLENGTRVIGPYDGYGNVGQYEQFDVGQTDDPGFYHKACWEAAGKPEYDGPSESSNDQGWFFDDGEHNMAKPAKTA